MTSTAVRVALRVRPLTHREQLSNCSECLTFIPNEPQVLIGTDKSFTYDHVFDTTVGQSHVYSTAAAPLLHKFVDGFNATILAYGYALFIFIYIFISSYTIVDNRITHC
ncbi:P-loop containing nucleoside triphosphate hydrolase protein [Radiomyces spectabilis]|uniref:P-loop containing nucleoside triphosphate hydrolase protein n=1 Tax=Radiomyces spectabilis TaxID=64574 RepID=UPI00221E59C6|nr:P-loop containing nucleoside triphosphate hydrolase protein [Radiomyces spectabilis]KAI8380954.1 P-loop containing nucleoside triphosphate hydrolase protein [Radiomyces spectabilis]